MKPIDQGVLALARSQHGVFHRHQAEAEGATPAMIASRLRSGV